DYYCSSYAGSNTYSF
nr:immunoglobulin light chain junction region [Macaca mulatta]